MISIKKTLFTETKYTYVCTIHIHSQFLESCADAVCDMEESWDLCFSTHATFLSIIEFRFVDYFIGIKITNL